MGSEGRESYAKVMPFTNVNGKRVKVNNQELEDLKHALKHVEGEYRIAETRIQELSGHMEAQKTALEDTKQVVNVLLKTVESLSEKLGKAKRKS